MAFSAKLLGNTILETGATVPFTDLISNFGNHYNTGTYTFTCPLNGAYSFSMTINQYGGDFIQAIMSRSGTELIRTTADDEGCRDSATVSIVTECLAGEQVYVTVLSGGNFDGGMSPCHFSGYLIEII